MLHLGELELTGVYHSSVGDAKVRLAVSLVAGADVQLAPGGETLTLTPNGDDANTQIAVELLEVIDGPAAAGQELQGLFALFIPTLPSLIAHSFPFPPVAVPALDLGIVTPGFTGRKGGFDGVLQFDPGSERIGVAGTLLAR
jgi:hypothetical protein